MLSSQNDARPMAMLIDGDNSQPSLLPHILAETAKYGVVTTRRVYGDWTTPQMTGWKECLNFLAVQPVQQFRYTVGKNATDSALIIDAMDLLHGGKVAGFCIVSSDSDYTRLTTRIREQSLFVMGVGRNNTPKSFVNACEVFVYTQNLVPQAEREGPTLEPDAAEWIGICLQSIRETAQEDGWADLSRMSNKMRLLDPAFDSRTYGHRRPSTLIRSQPEVFEMRETPSAGGASVLHVKPHETEG